MINNSKWTQIKKIDYAILIDHAIEQYICSLDILHKFYNYSDFENKKNAIETINKTINLELNKYFKKQNINLENINNNLNSLIKLSKLDYFKLYIISQQIYHFWNLPYENLLFFYLENLKYDKDLNVDLFVGRLKYLFESSELDFEIIEKYIRLNNIIGT